MPGDIRPEGLQVTSGPSDRGDLREQTRGKRQEYCADFTSRFLANSPCSRPTPRDRCRVTHSSRTPSTLLSGNSPGACAEIGRAAGREKGGQEGWLTGVAVTLKKKPKQIKRLQK